MFDHILYLLPDGGSHWAEARLVLYPDTPVPAGSVRPDFLIRLLEEKIVGRCDAAGNLAPEDIRFAIEAIVIEETPVEEQASPSQDPIPSPDVSPVSETVAPEG